MATRRTTRGGRTAEGSQGLGVDTGNGGAAQTGGPESAPPIPRSPRRRSTATAATPQPAREAAYGEVTPEQRHSMIAEAAYHRAERRGFEPGYELDDWLAAEKEVDALLAAGRQMPPQ